MLVKAMDYAVGYIGRFRRLSELLRLPTEQVRQFYQEVGGFVEEIAEREREVIGQSWLAPYLSMWSPLRGQALYVMCRALRPRVVVETGVADGVSSAFILKALDANERGELHSIDLPNQPRHQLPEDHSCGWIVPHSLRRRWHLQLGPAQELLKPLLNDLERVDLFLHDSDHSFEHMMFEFHAVWEALIPGGLLVADDISLNLAFDQFGRQVGRVPVKLYHRFGGLCK